MSRGAIRRLAGAAWLLVWCAALWCVAAPWRDLGGLESEFLRWLEWWELFGGLALGFTVGRGVRDVASTENGRTHAAALRLLLYPPALLTATSLVALTATGGRRGVIGVVVTAFLSYWAGLDVAVGAVPLMEGKDYAFERRIAPDDDEARPDERDLWDRF